MGELFGLVYAVVPQGDGATLRRVNYEGVLKVLL